MMFRYSVLFMTQVKSWLGHRPDFVFPGPGGFGPQRDFRRDPRFGPDRRTLPGWGSSQDWLDHIDATNLLALKRTLRHLEA